MVRYVQKARTVVGSPVKAEVRTVVGSPVKAKVRTVVGSPVKAEVTAATAPAILYPTVLDLVAVPEIGTAAMPLVRRRVSCKSRSQGYYNVDTMCNVKVEARTDSEAEAEDVDTVRNVKGEAGTESEAKACPKRTRTLPLKYKRRVESHIAYYQKNPSATMGSAARFRKCVLGLVKEICPDKNLKVEKAAVEKLQLAAEGLIENFIKARHMMPSLPTLKVIADSLGPDLRMTLMDPKLKLPVVGTRA